MPVSSEYSGETSKFNGKIELVQIDTCGDDQSHLIDPADLIRVVMSRQ